MMSLKNASLLALTLTTGLSRGSSKWGRLIPLE